MRPQQGQQQYPVPTLIPGHQGPPASGRPVADYLSVLRPGVSHDGAYVVLPRALLEQLPLQVQHDFVRVLNAIHGMTTTGPAPAPWPGTYQVQAMRWARIGDLSDDAEMAQAGVIAELDTDGELIFRYMDGGATLTDQDKDRRVLIRCRDALAPQTPQAPLGAR